MSTEIIETTELMELVQETETATEVVETIINQCEHCGTIIELLEGILSYMEMINGLSFRLSQVLEFLLAFLVIVVFSAVCYIILKGFTRF